MRGATFHWTIAALVVLLLAAPSLVVLGASFTAGTLVQFPPDGFSLRWYARVLAAVGARTFASMAELPGLLGLAHPGAGR